MKAIDFLKNKGITKATCYTDVGTYYVGELAKLMEEYAALRQPHVINAKRTVCHTCKEDIADYFVPRIEDLKCPECGNKWHTDL